MTNIFPSTKIVYVLRRDGVEVLRATEQECWAYLHRTHPYSGSHALRYEGYTLTVEGC